MLFGPETLSSKDRSWRCWGTGCPVGEEARGHLLEAESDSRHIRMGCVWEWGNREIERHTHTEKKTDTERQRLRERPRQKETETETDRQTNKQTDTGKLYDKETRAVAWEPADRSRGHSCGLARRPRPSPLLNKAGLAGRK